MTLESCCADMFFKQYPFAPALRAAKIVCVEVQRGGPSTGLPTKTEQADLFQVYGASQGEFPPPHR
jgi:pyruvate/2-oxoacid:ferredoxin oxidoreductase alpha subunit